MKQKLAVATFNILNTPVRLVCYSISKIFYTISIKVRPFNTMINKEYHDKFMTTVLNIYHAWGCMIVIFVDTIFMV